MNAPRDMSPRLAGWATLLIWLICAGTLVFTGRALIAHLQFSDPDDAMRLVQVRDWMAGQSWFDVSQHRSWPPHGAPMHWSRLVDMPIAAIMTLASLFAAPPMAERIALVAVPLLTLLGLFAIIYSLTRRITGRRDMAVVAAAMLAMSLGVLVQFHPLRIDHHGWQITLGTLGVLMLVRIESGRLFFAVLAGIAIAASMIVAIEGLPLAVGIGAVLGLGYVRQETDGAALAAYLVALCGASALLMIAMLGWPAAGAFWCDSLSPAYLVPMVVATGTLLAVRRLVPQQRAAWRLASLTIAGAAAALTFASYSRQCMAGPFGTLDPLIYKIWYLSIAEGMPVWSQPFDLKILIPLPSLLGIAGTLLAIRLDAAERRDGWIMLLCLQLLTFIVSVLVMRAMGLAHVLALPGSAWLFLTAFRTATSMPMSAARIMLGVGCVALTPIGAEAIAAAFMPHSPANETAEMSKDRYICTSYQALRGLDALPPTVIFAPLDISAHLLAYTRHSVVATGHHRNRPGMKEVISAFVAPPDKARAIIGATPARYLALCPDENEVRKYARVEPHGLMGDLLQGKVPDWLKPVPMRKDERIRVYQILAPPQLATKRIATPFMQ